MVTSRVERRTVDGGLAGLMERARSFTERNKLYVGIPQEKTSRTDEPINNASLLYIHTHGIRRRSMREEMQGYMNAGAKYSLAFRLYLQTHGSPLWHSPPRPVIEPALLKYRAEVSEEYSKAIRAALEGDFARARAQIHRTGLLAQNYCRGWFTDKDNGWAPNSPRTVAMKGSANPLIDTGALRKAIIYVTRSD